MILSSPSPCQLKVCIKNNLVKHTQTMTTPTLPQKLHRTVQEVIHQSNLSMASVRCILLSTTEGVALGRVFAEEYNNDMNLLNEEVIESIESVWAPASKHFPMLGLDKIQYATAFYDHGVLMHVYFQAPLVSQLYERTNIARLFILTYFLIDCNNSLWPTCQCWLSTIYNDTSFENRPRASLHYVDEFAQTRRL